MKNTIKQIINRGQEYISYVGATAVSAAVHFVYSIFVKSYIEPLEFGIYSSCLLIQTYLAYIQFGSLNSFNRDYPQLIGAGNTGKAQKYRDTVFSFLLIAFGVATIIVSIIILAFSKERDSRYTYGMIFCVILTSITSIENYLTSRVRIDGGFKYTSFVLIAELVSVIIGFVLIPKIGYYGLYFVSIGSMLIGIVLYFKRGISDFHFGVDRKLLKEIIWTGVPLMINGLIWTVVNSIDKFVILGFINTEALGIYSIAQMTFSYMILIPNAVSQLFYVRLGKVYGATNSVEELNHAAMKYTLLLAVGTCIIVIFAYFLMEPIVKWLMPKYLSGVYSAQILMFGLAFYAPAMVNGNILTILKKNAVLLRMSIYLCVFNVALSIGLVLAAGKTIENVALGTSISYFIMTLILLYALRKYARNDMKSIIRVSILPVVFSLGISYLSKHVIQNTMIGVMVALSVTIGMIYILYGKEIRSLLR